MPEEVPETPLTALTYLRRGLRGIFAEVYFPRRIAAQGTIFDALEDGHDEEKVRAYLKRAAPLLVDEVPDHSQVLDPQWYDVPQKKRQKPVAKDIEPRIAAYKSPFSGWSNYAVDGVWFNDDPKSLDFNKPVEEATQVIRLLFSFQSTLAPEAREAGHYDILRVMFFWMISRQARFTDVPRWHKDELKRFMREYEPLTPVQRAFIKKYFEPLAREVFKWMGDWFLFVFGYLVRKFAEKLTQRQSPEKVIMVTTFFNLTVSELVKAN